MRPKTPLKTYPFDDIAMAAPKRTPYPWGNAAQSSREKSTTAGEANEAAGDIEIGKR